MKRLVLLICLIGIVCSCTQKPQQNTDSVQKPVKADAIKQVLPVAVLYAASSGYPEGVYMGRAGFSMTYPGTFDAPQGRSKVSAWLEHAMRTMIEQQGIRAFIIAPAVTGMVTAVQEVRKTYPDIIIAAIEPENNIYEVEAECDFVLATDYRKCAYGAIVTAKKLGIEKIIIPDYSKEPKNSLAYFYNNTLLQSIKYENAESILYNEKTFDYSMQNAAVLYAPSIKFSEEKIAQMNNLLVFIPGFPISYKPYLEALFNQYGNDGSWLPTLPGRLLGIINKYYITVNPYIKMVVPGYPQEVALVESACNEIARILEAKNYRRTAITRFVNTKTVLENLKKIDSSIGWEASYFTDPATGIRSMRTILVAQDFYQIGKGFIPIARQRIPAQVTGQ
ncbi:MAG TPA: DUF3798 domain-containing protein [Spirochaetia bacterium]|nr:DUF3798 domain-containing protein [Spirochaetales bacterium]HRS65336.1 DUF3798 domain-containing protein [Spirochaetia bacterium]HOT59725.1 DUF3798 domain-containing protein [Spirochaetales bacterium]HPD79611.1 DUF3798 domain-containing protein [Spirochaetales bacterium]HQG40819.1 DUF3798 domain-containing protein [Spirochaetales bacterium]